MASDRDFIRKLGPVGQSFFGRFHVLREIQRRSLEPIFLGKNVLVSSATASGKTEAVFAPLVARLRATRPRAEKRIRLLAVAPTRALVNDLHVRLGGPLTELGWSCGRQTSDHRDKSQRPDVLITTPESFDSMMVRDGVWKQGILSGHLLAHVEAVFVDEVHLFASSPRGDQVVWLLGRLRRLKEHAVRMGWTLDKDVQVCAASATVQDHRGLANKVLGKESEVVLVPGTLEMELLSGRQKTGCDLWRAS
jgi:ATP-dependent Lhr-like helicase